MKTQNLKIWVSLLGYFLITFLLIVYKDHSLLFSNEIIINRSLFFLVFIIFVFLSKRLNSLNFQFLMTLAIYSLLALLYKETGTLNQLFYPVSDPILMQWDEKIFGFQPALVFSQKFGIWWFSELMFMAYFCYYLLPLAVLTLLYKDRNKYLGQFGFVLITSFLIYYAIFIIFPAIGPQFYYQPPDNHIEAQGIFGNLIKVIQKNGEVPTAAFPSSHVGISIIILIWLWRHKINYTLYFIPNVILLILATVYIKAHYVVDVIAGILTAPLVYYFSISLYNRLLNHGDKRSQNEV